MNVAPSIPVDPDDPSKPTDPSDPSDPSKPTDPSDPSDPSKPTDPSKATYIVSGIITDLSTGADIKTAEVTLMLGSEELFISRMRVSSLSISHHQRLRRMLNLS